MVAASTATRPMWTWPASSPHRRRLAFHQCSGERPALGAEFPQRFVFGLVPGSAMLALGDSGARSEPRD
eukprot:9368235-Lingulodinium_polyedra.AAC.1